MNSNEKQELLWEGAPCRKKIMNTLIWESVVAVILFIATIESMMRCSQDYGLLFFLAVMWGTGLYWIINELRKVWWNLNATYKIGTYGLLAVHKNGESKGPSDEQLQNLEIEIHERSPSLCHIWWKPRRKTSKSSSLGEGFLFVPNTKQLHEAVLRVCPNVRTVNLTDKRETWVVRTTQVGVEQPKTDSEPKTQK